MAKKQQTKPAFSLQHAASGLRTIQNGLDQALAAAQEIALSLGHELSALLGRNLTILADEGRAGLKQARHEVAIGADALETLLKDVDKLLGDTAAPVKRAVKKSVRRGRKRVAKAVEAAEREIRKAAPKKKGKKTAGPSLGDAIASVMNEAGRAMKAAELAAILKAKGIKSRSKNFARVVQTKLTVDKKFKKDPEGGYRLA